MRDSRYEGGEIPQKQRRPGRETYRNGPQQGDYHREAIREYAKGTPRPISEQDLDTYEVVDPREFFGYVEDFYDLISMGAIEKIERILEVPHSFEKKITTTVDGINMYFVIEKATPRR